MSVLQSVRFPAHHPLCHQSICPLPLKIFLLHPLCLFLMWICSRHSSSKVWLSPPLVHHPAHQWRCACGAGPESATQWHAAHWAAVWQIEPPWPPRPWQKDSCGTRQHGTLKGASNTISLFVFRVDKGVSEDDIKTYLSEENITDTWVQCDSHADARAKSFRVNVNNKDKDKVMSSDFWPDGMACRLFYQKRKNDANRPSMSGNNADGSWRRVPIDLYLIWSLQLWR